MKHHKKNAENPNRGFSTYNKRRVSREVVHFRNHVQIQIGNCDLEERCIHTFFYVLTRFSFSPSLIFSLSARFFLSSFVGTRDTRLRAHISNTRGDHFQQQPCSLRTRGIYRYREIFPSPNLVVNDSVYHFQQHTLYESFIPRTPVFARIFQTLELTK